MSPPWYISWFSLSNCKQYYICWLVNVDGVYIVVNMYSFLVPDLFFHPTVFWMSISWRQRIYWYMDILRYMDMFLITKILDLAYVHNYMRCLSQIKSDTKLFRVYLFTVFTIKRPTGASDSDKWQWQIYSNYYKEKNVPCSPVSPFGPCSPIVPFCPRTPGSPLAPLW